MSSRIFFLEPKIIKISFYIRSSYTKLRDDPNVRWREEIVSETLLQHIDAYDIDTVLTFDRRGVSGHPNHSSLYNAMVFLSLEDRLPPNVRVYALCTVNLFRKYSSLLAVPMSFLLCPTVYLASPRDWTRLHRAMAAHASQYVWFRKLYMLFSRYALINTYDQLNSRLSNSNYSSAMHRKKSLHQSSCDQQGNSAMQQRAAQNLRRSSYLMNKKRE